MSCSLVAAHSSIFWFHVWIFLFHFIYNLLIYPLCTSEISKRAWILKKGNILSKNDSCLFYHEYKPKERENHSTDNFVHLPPKQSILKQFMLMKSNISYKSKIFHDITSLIIKLIGFLNSYKAGICIIG